VRGGPIKRGGQNFKSGGKKLMSIDELDKQLEAYMGSRHPSIMEP